MAVVLQSHSGATPRHRGIRKSTVVMCLIGYREEKWPNILTDTDLAGKGRL